VETDRQPTKRRASECWPAFGNPSPFDTLVNSKDVPPARAAACRQRPPGLLAVGYPTTRIGLRSTGRPAISRLGLSRRKSMSAHTSAIGQAELLQTILIRCFSPAPGYCGERRGVEREAAQHQHNVR
jgi:hypothetical protein